MRERLSRVFYQNYIGSIVDWYAATLMRRAPVVTFDGMGASAKRFYAALSGDCDFKGTTLTEFFRQGLVETLVCGSSYIVVDFPRANGPAATRAEEDASGRSRAYLVNYGPDEVINWSYDETGRLGMGSNPNGVPAAIESYRRQVGAGDALDLLRPRELQDLRQTGESKPVELIDEGRHGFAALAARPGVSDEGERGVMADQ